MNGADETTLASQQPYPTLEHRTLIGVDGITFLDGALYVNNAVFN